MKRNLNSILFTAFLSIVIILSNKNVAMSKDISIYKTIKLSNILGPKINNPYPLGFHDNNILFEITDKKTKNIQIIEYNLSSKKYTILINSINAIYYPIISPDNSMIAYLSYDQKIHKTKINIFNLNKKILTKTVTTEFNKNSIESDLFKWSSSNKNIVFCSFTGTGNSRKLSAINIFNINTGATKSISIVNKYEWLYDFQMDDTNKKLFIAAVPLNNKNGNVYTSLYTINTNNYSISTAIKDIKGYCKLGMPSQNNLYFYTTYEYSSELWKLNINTLKADMIYDTGDNSPYLEHLTFMNNNLICISNYMAPDTVIDSIDILKLVGNSFVHVVSYDTNKSIFLTDNMPISKNKLMLMVDGFIYFSTSPLY